MVPILLQNEGCGYVDHGGAYVRPTQDYVLRLAEELNCPLHKVNEKEDVVCYKNVLNSFRRKISINIINVSKTFTYNLFLYKTSLHKEMF